MIDFTELPADGVKFEQLIRELLVRSAFDVHWTGVGPDGGRDLIAVENVAGLLAPFQRKWLVSCKHFANANRSVGVDDVRDMSDTCAAVGASGFLLACSTQPSSALVRRFEEIEAQRRLVVRYWDGVEIENRLSAPQTLPLIYLFFPASAAAVPWHIYATLSPSFWAANYKDYLVYLASRTAHSFPSLVEVEEIVARLESIKLPEGSDWARHHLRPRAVHFDDKHEQFTVFADYLFPEGQMADVVGPQALNEILRDGMGLHGDEDSMWYITFWDIRYVPCTQISEHFHLDHKNYYEPFMRQYQLGAARNRLLSDMI
ncbi:MAG: restriction endonuclease [Betaproteobacteria bacterium]|nr:restriction endonuclease [Betaproteobacteria bacterium]